MINLNLLDPWVKARVKDLKNFADRNLMTANVSSGFRSSQEQWRLWNQCETGAGVRGFPVKHPGCSQHEWGFAVDIEARPDHVNAPTAMGQWGAAAFILCAAFPDLAFLCDDGRSGAELSNAQRTLGEEARRLGLFWSGSDSVHYSAFPASAWDPHMRRWWGADCRTCTHPLGAPF